MKSLLPQHLLWLCPLLLILNLSSAPTSALHVQAPDCGCIEASALDRSPNKPFSWNLYSHKPGSKPDALPKACAAFCESKRRGLDSRHFILEHIPLSRLPPQHARIAGDRYVCKCYENVHPFDCDEEVTGVELVEVYCKEQREEEVRRELPAGTSTRRMHEEGDHTEPNYNYYHQQRTAVSVRAFHELVEEEQEEAAGEEDLDRPRRRPEESLDDDESEVNYMYKATAAQHRPLHDQEADEAKRERKSDSETEKEAVAVSAIVLGLFALMCLLGLALKTWCDHRRERIKRAAAEESVEEAARREAAANRGRLMSLGAGPLVYEKK